MNAKVAKVKLLIDDEVIAFDDYELRHGAGGLTCGALTAQVSRFYQLWSTYVFVEPTCWSELDDTQKAHLRSVLDRFLFQMKVGADPQVARREVEASVGVIRNRKRRAARSGTQEPDEAEYAAFTFPSGLPYRVA
jgi:hypothetical protein